RTHLDDLPELAPNVKWLQATSSGIGQKLHKLKYDLRMPDSIFTSARGVHAQPLAEFCIMIMLAFSKKLLLTLESQRNKHWARFAGTDLRNKTIGIIGMGKVGVEVARMAKCFGMKVLGMKREVEGIDISALNVDELYGMNQFERILPRSQYLVLIAPHTPESEKMIGRKQLEMLPEGAILINIGRGALVDQHELIKSLRSGHLGGAGLDVFEEEPLPQDSPLWNMENVIVSPHSGSTSDSENALITDIFCENLRRYLKGEPLLNVIDVEKMF
ncbi:MAG: D-2-hydroxyacid dehydrogenase, partial [Cyclobacteriaceae bacterium]